MLIRTHPGFGTLFEVIIILQTKPRFHKNLVWKNGVFSEQKGKEVEVIWVVARKCVGVTVSQPNANVGAHFWIQVTDSPKANFLSGTLPINCLRSCLRLCLRSCLRSCMHERSPCSAAIRMT